jgi:hypothetical protein
MVIIAVTSISQVMVDLVSIYTEILSDGPKRFD